jgi:hypothetical protein
MEENVNTARKEVAETMANLKKLETKAKQSQEETEKWQKNAEFAVKKRDDELAKDTVLERNVALKILDDKFLFNKRIKEKFFKEARTSSFFPISFLSIVVFII